MLSINNPSDQAICSRSNLIIKLYGLHRPVNVCSPLVIIIVTCTHVSAGVSRINESKAAYVLIYVPCQLIKVN